MSFFLKFTYRSDAQTYTGSRAVMRRDSFVDFDAI